MSNKMLGSDSGNRKVLKGFVTVFLFVFIGKVAGAVKEMTIAWRYGVSEKVDAYVFLYGLINWPLSVWFSILSVVLIPLVAKLRTGNPEELPRFRAELFGMTLMVGIAAGVVTAIMMPILMRTGFLGLSGAALADALSMISGFSLLLPLGAVIGLCSAMLLASGYHRNTLFEGIPALVILLFMLLPPDYIPEPLLWGTVAGVALHMSALVGTYNHNCEAQRVSFKNKSPAWQYFWGSIGIMAIGQTLTSLTGLIDQFFASRLDPGSLSKLSYANRLLSLIMSLGATAISRATLPVFSEVSARGNDSVNKMALGWAARMFFLGGLVAATMWVMAPFVVRLLFERGAFTSTDTSEVSQIFRYSLLQVPTYFPSLVLVSALAAKGLHRLIAFSGVLNLAFKLPISLALINAFHLKGLVLSTTVMYALSVVFLFILLKTNDRKAAT